ncbi:hypothetical protein GMRT_15229 [Giardia muris]|uniref:NOD3 protein n=1 Tax=Giardia muris TaxID=5742 RepID=A0A4Z1T2I6_GIAMU|nr:hypothetical protein GMRT_15229 [Giardia muris]|eukprot:TNJ28153.1 hypothetical protein GMRT_15229 [Giardia muris]
MIDDLRTPLWSQLYEQKCSDLGIIPTENLYDRFITTVTADLQNGVLNLADQALRATSMPIVCGILQHFYGAIHTLDLSMNPIMDEGAALLLEVGEPFFRLRTLRIKSIGLTPIGVNQFFVNLAERRSEIVEIDMSSTSAAECRNRPGDLGAVGLAYYFSVNKAIRVFNLTNTQLRGAVGVSLFKGIQAVCSLTHLHLQNTDVANRVIEYIFTRTVASGEPIFSNLVYLDLTGNAGTLTSDCCQHIETGIRTFKRLDTLLLARNPGLASGLGLALSALGYKSAAAAAEHEAYNKRMDERIQWKDRMFKSICPGMRNLLETGKIVVDRASFNEEDERLSLGGQTNAQEEGETEEEPVFISGDTCSIKTLDISHISLPSKVIAQLAVALKTNETLNSLTMMSCNIDSKKDGYREPVEALLTSILSIPHLQSLALSTNKLGDVGAQCIGAALQGAPKLASLNLAYCDITDAGMRPLLLAISNCTLLHTLNLEGNSATDVSARVMYSTLGSCPQLINLNLELNKITYSLFERIRGVVIENRGAQTAKETEQLEHVLQGESDLLQDVLSLKHEIQQKHDALGQRCADLITDIQKYYNEYNTWSSEIDGLNTELDEAQRENNQEEGKLNEINQQISQLTSKGEAELAVIDMKRRQAKERSVIASNKVSELEQQCEEKLRAFQETVIIPKEQQLQLLKGELDLQLKNQIKLLGILLATEQTLVAEKKITVEGIPSGRPGTTTPGSRSTQLRKH